MQSMRSEISREGYHCHLQYKVGVITKMARVGANLAETGDNPRNLLPNV